MTTRLYLDTSVLVSAFSAERSSVWAQALLSNAQYVIIVSDWAVTEFHASMHAKARRGELDQSTLAERMATFRLAVSSVWVWQAVARADFAAASVYAEDLFALSGGAATGQTQVNLSASRAKRAAAVVPWLRSADALHIAVAKSAKADGFATLDHQQAAAVALLGSKMAVVIDLDSSLAL